MNHAARTLITTFALVSTLAACSTTSVAVIRTAPSRTGEVGVEDLTATIAPSARMELADNESFLPPLAEPGNPPPAYPTELLARHLSPQTVCLRVSVSETGAVASSAPLVLPPDCLAPTGDTLPFVAAAQAAVAGWRYDPAVRCVFEHDPKPDYPTCVGARETPQAVSLTYRFVFEQQDGRGSVRMTQ